MPYDTCIEKNCDKTIVIPQLAEDHKEERLKVPNERQYYRCLDCIKKLSQ